MRQATSRSIAGVLLLLAIGVVGDRASASRADGRLTEPAAVARWTSQTETEGLFERSGMIPHAGLFAPARAGDVIPPSRLRDISASRTGRT